MMITNYFFIFSAEYLYLIAGLIALICFWKLPKEKKKEIIMFGVIALPAIYVVSKISAHLYFNPRPFVVGHFTPLIPHEADNGFPSDHVLLVSAIASIIFPFSKKISGVIWLIAALIGISRVYVGIHHPIDIIGSIIISIVVSVFVFFVYDKFIKRHALKILKSLNF